MNTNISNQVDQYRQQFEKEGVVVIPNFLEESYANTLHEYIYGGQKSSTSKLEFLMPPQWWYYSIRSNKGYHNINNTPENQEEIKTKIAETYDSFNKGDLSFCFKRTMSNHVKTCYCEECKALPFIKSTHICQILSQITNIPLTTTESVFFSCYESGDYLSIHSDKGNGKVAFVLNLTKNWRPQFGGNLHILDSSDWRTSKHVITPTFNSLVLFKVPEHGIPHFVSHVAPNVNNKRIALAGWYK